MSLTYGILFGAVWLPVMYFYAPALAEGHTVLPLSVRPSVRPSVRSYVLLSVRPSSNPSEQCYLLLLVIITPIIQLI